MMDFTTLQDVIRCVEQHPEGNENNQLFIVDNLSMGNLRMTISVPVVEGN